MQVNEPAINAKEIVMEYLEAVQRKDFKSARNYVSDNMSYMGPVGFGSFNKAEPYFKYLEHLDLPKLEIKKVFADGHHDVCLLYELNYGTPPTTTFVSAWFQVYDGKISSIRLVFDPRPFVQQRK
jgi:ketosteroid isomerase-like protein